MILAKVDDLAYTPARIISLVPSITELLFTLGLDSETIAITKFCIHPREWFQRKKRIGGTKQLHSDEIHALQPDLIFANKEENVKEQVEELAADFPVWLTEVDDYDEAIEMILDIGKLTNRQVLSEQLVKQIHEKFSAIAQNEKIPAAYIIWREPYMSVGSDTFIHDMMQRAGFENVFGAYRRYPEVTMEDIRRSGCRAVLLSSEPFPFKEKHMAELAPVLPGIELRLVDGELFSWYGSRMLKAPEYFENLYQSMTTG